jgi:hypothetical protein
LPRVDDSGQQGFFDQPIESPETLIKVREACDLVTENADAASSFAKGKRQLKELLPAVEQPTRFLCGEDLAIEVKPGHREEYTVEETDGIQRKKIVRNFESES